LQQELEELEMRNQNIVDEKGRLNEELEKIRRSTFGSSAEMAELRNSIQDLKS